MQSSKGRGGISNKFRHLKIWKITDTHQLCQPSAYQYMNPASYGHAVYDADSTISYSSSENWYRRRVKPSKSSNRSSAQGNSGFCESADDAYIGDLLSKNEDRENLSTNLDHQVRKNLMPLISSKRIEQSISKLSSHLNINENNLIDEVPENNNLLLLEEDTDDKSDRGGKKRNNRKNKLGIIGMDDDFVEEIIEDDDDNKSIPDFDDVVDEVGDVEMPMGETGHKFNEVVLSDDEYDSVVLEDKNTSINTKAKMFNQRMSNKFSSSYEYKSKYFLIKGNKKFIYHNF